MKQVGTLKEIGAQVGDVVDFGCGHYTITEINGKGYWAMIGDELFGPLGDYRPWRIVSRASDKPKLWRDMTPEEKGALLLACHEGKVIEAMTHCGSTWWKSDCAWLDNLYYRIKPEPKIETVVMYWGKVNDWISYEPNASDTHSITFNLIDGIPDCSSVKMEKL